MNLYDITIDLFAYLMAFRIRVRGGIKTTLEEVQKDLLKIFREQETKVRQNPALSSVYDQVRYVLVVFADEVILNSDWEYARDWEGELLERRFFESEVGGDRFFELCEGPAINNPVVASIYYTCLLMGFRGKYEPESEELRILKQSIQAKCPQPHRNQQEMLCPEAYNVRERKLQRLPSILRWRQIAILFAVLLGFHIVVDRMIIWNYLTEPLKNIENLAAARLTGSVLPSPIPARSKLSQRVTPRPVSKTKSPHSDLTPAVSRDGDERRAESFTKQNLRKKIDPGSYKPEVKQKTEEKALPVVTNKKSKSSSGYTLQVGAFISKKNAEELVQMLKGRGYHPYMVKDVMSSGKVWYLVQMGYYKAGEAKRARKAAAEFTEKEHMEAFVISRVQ